MKGRRGIWGMFRGTAAAKEKLVLLFNDWL